jgi:hypothetical protein
MADQARLDLLGFGGHEWHLISLQLMLFADDT